VRIKENNQEPAERVSNSVNLSAIFGHVVNSGVTLIAAFFIFTGTQGTNEAAMLETAFKQIREQNASYEILKVRQDQAETEFRNKLEEANKKIAKLELQLNQNLLPSLETIQAYINAQATPTWIKRFRPDGKLEMLMINEAYTVEFGKTPTDYVGKTDFDLYPQEVAEQYEANDLTVHLSGRSFRTTEKLRQRDGTFVDGIVIKFPIKLSDGTAGIGGLAVLNAIDKE
jgi:PAS domain-containing protein